MGRGLNTYMGVLILTAVVSFLLTPLIGRLARHLGAVDEPSARKVHLTATPRMGGLAVFLGFASPWPLFYLFDNRVTLTFINYETLFLGLLSASVIMLTLGIYDDVKGANARKKFAVQILAGSILYLAGFRITVLSNPFGAPIHLGFLAWPVSVFWVVALTNAINLLDGLDGLLTGVAAIITLALGIINVLAGNIIVALMTLGLSGACLGFLPRNYSPAKIFLGDCGSLFIGLLLSAVSMYCFFKETTVTLIFAPLVLFAVPLFDTMSVMIGRLFRGHPVFQADKSHVHHRLLELGLTQRAAVAIIHSVTAVLAILAVFLTVKQTQTEALWASALFITAIFGTWVVWRLRIHVRKA